MKLKKLASLAMTGVLCVSMLAAAAVRRPARPYPARRRPAPLRRRARATLLPWVSIQL